MLNWNWATNRRITPQTIGLQQAIEGPEKIQFISSSLSRPPYQNFPVL
jgi:hypothetical protein